MAHYFSRHEMKKFDKKLTEENFIDTNRFKDQLKTEISRENHRINIDSAKKKAVLQGMNYDSFHQMVLGADLKGIKQGEISSIGPSNSIMNNIATQTKFTKNVEILKNAFVVNKENIGIDAKINESLNNIDIVDEKNDEDILDQKHFIKEWKTININQDRENSVENNIIKKLNLLKKYDNDKFLNMLNEKKMQSDIFLDLLNIFGEFTKSYLNKNDLNSFLQIAKLIKYFFNSKYFNSLKIFIGKKHKVLFSDCLKSIELQIDLEDLSDDIQNEIKNINLIFKSHFN